MGADGRADLGGLDALTRAWFDEWRFLKVIPLTHEEYLDADPLFVRWMLEIDALMSEKRGPRDTDTGHSRG